MGFGEECRLFVERVWAPAKAAAHTLATRPDFPRLFRRVLVNQWHVIQASEELIGLATAFSAGPRREYFARKAADEAGHATVMLGDMSGLGVDPGLPADPHVVAMVGSQYFHLHHGETSAFLGYIAVLELSVAGADIDAVEVLARLPAGSLQCARLHTKADVGHTEDLSRVLDELPEELQPGVLSNAAQVALFSTLAMETLLRLPETETRATQ